MFDVARFVAQVAIILFLIDVSMYFFFEGMRQSKTRARKVTIAKATRYFMRVHIPFALIGAGLILIHAVLMLTLHPLSILHLKKLSGVIALLLLILLVINGYQKRRRTSL